MAFRLHGSKTGIPAFWQVSRYRLSCEPDYLCLPVCTIDGTGNKPGGGEYRLKSLDIGWKGKTEEDLQ